MANIPQVSKGSATASLIAKLKSEYPDVYDALRSLQLDLDSVLRILNTSNEELNRTKTPNLISSLVWPKGSNFPPYAQPVEGKEFYNTSRARHQFSTDTWPYYDVSTPESIRLFNSANITIANVTETQLTFDTEIFRRMMVAAVNSKIIIPLDGCYLVGAHLQWDVGAGATRILYLKKNTTIYIAIDSKAPVGGGLFTEQSVSTVYNFAVGDTVQLNCYQNTGANLNINSAVEYSPILYCHRLG